MPWPLVRPIPADYGRAVSPRHSLFHIVIWLGDHRPFYGFMDILDLAKAAALPSHVLPQFSDYQSQVTGIASKQPGVYVDGVIKKRPGRR